MSSLLQDQKRDAMKAISHTGNFVLPVPIEDAFPLFSPEGEKVWAPGWDYENLMGTMELSEDYVFLTRSHDHAKTEAIWIVKAFDPDAYRVQFYKVEPGDKVGVVTVECVDLGDAGTRVHVTYKYIALSTAGERFITGFNADVYDAFLAEWRTHLCAHFAARE